jgi:iron complex transport system ATP-binding protein
MSTLSAHYDGFTALDAIDLTLPEQKIIAFCGPNGSGKSTALKVLRALHAPSGGEAEVAGQALDDWTPRALAREIAMLSQSPDAPEDMTVFDLAMLGRYSRRSRFSGPSAEDRRAVENALRTTGMDALAGRSIGQLSGGQVQRAWIAMTLAQDAPRIFLDEPTNHLDIDSRGALTEALNDFPGAVILVAHDRHLIDATAERLWLVRDGTVAPFDGDLDEYRRLVTQTEQTSEKASGEERTGSKAEQRRDAAARREALKPLARKIKETESLMESLRKKIQALDAELHDPKLYERDAGRAARLAKERADKAGELETREEEWLMLSEQYETGLTA